MYLKKGRPKLGELVICRPKKFMPHSVILDLIEYEDCEGFLHISQVSQGWVKDISNFIQKDSEIICRVIRDEDRSVEVSLKQVSKDASNAKSNEWRLERKAVNTVNAVARKIGKEKELENELVKPVMREYGSINAFLELLKQEGDKIMAELKIPAHWKQPILDYVSQSVKIVHLSKQIEAYTTRPNGLEKLKKALLNFEKEGISVKYVSAPKYLLRVTSTNYKEAQKKLEGALKKLEKDASEHGLTVKTE